MFVARQSMRASMAAARRGLATAAASASRSNRRAAAGLGALACSAALAGAALVAGSSASASCESSSAAAPACCPHKQQHPHPTAATPEGVIEFFAPTHSQYDKLPQTADELAKLSLDELAKKFYDPKHEDGSNLAKTIIFGAPGPEDAPLPALPLLFTSRDEDPFHRHMELLVRSFQDRICNNLIDIERLGAHLPLGKGHKDAPATLSNIAGVAVESAAAREQLLSQGETAGMFRQTVVIRPGESGGGIERVLAGGRVFAKAGVNVSVSRGTRPAATFQSLLADHPSLADVPVPASFDLFTASVSLVLHPVSPAVPTVHANYRYFELVLPDGTVKCWFGGGSDLTPTYVNETDAKFFHSTLRGQLARVPGGADLYASWKPWCDRYFRLPHRGESRGVGGIFFEDWAPTKDLARDQMEKVVRTLGEGFSTTYFPIVLKRRLEPFTEGDLAFQQLRRGRYVEFNLLYDKGTIWGMKMPAHLIRPDAILMSLPPIARFAYKQRFDAPREKETKEILANPRDW